jgi:hypothetical protein
VLIGFLCSIAAGYFLQPYVIKIRWPKRGPRQIDLDRLHMQQLAQQYAGPQIGQYAESVLATRAKYGLVSHGILTANEIREKEQWWRQVNTW